LCILILKHGSSSSDISSVVIVIVIVGCDSLLSLIPPWGQITPVIKLVASQVVVVSLTLSLVVVVVVSFEVVISSPVVGNSTCAASPVV